MNAMTVLGRSGLQVSRICLGTMTFGARTDETEAGRIYGRAREAGINFVDTADVYNGGVSEEITGRLIKAERDNVILATKLANPLSKDPNQAGLSRRWIMDAVAGSLRRLGTDHIDILYLHKEDRTTPLQEAVKAGADKCVEILLEHGAEMNLTSPGELMCSTAATPSAENELLMKRLLRAGVPPDSCDCELRARAQRTRNRAYF